MNETDWRRLGEAVKRRRNELRLTQGQVQERGGPSPALVRAIENKRADTLSPSKRRDLERALDWTEGSVDEVLRGGSPTEFRDDPLELPRSTPAAPAISSITAALGQHPNRPGVQLAMSASDRKLLASARGKLLRDAGELNPDEVAVLTRFVEDDELRMLHARIDWLPRTEQLEVSELVTELENRVSSYDEMHPNPLPYDGVFPDAADYPSQVPSLHRAGSEDYEGTGETTQESVPEDAREDGDPGTTTTRAADGGDQHDNVRALNRPDPAPSLEWPRAASERRIETDDNTPEG